MIWLASVQSKPNAWRPLRARRRKRKASDQPAYRAYGADVNLCTGARYRRGWGESSLVWS